MRLGLNLGYRAAGVGTVNLSPLAAGGGAQEASAALRAAAEAFDKAGVS